MGLERRWPPPCPTNQRPRVGVGPRRHQAVHTARILPQKFQTVFLRPPPPPSSSRSAAPSPPPPLARSGTRNPPARRRRRVGLHGCLLAQDGEGARRRSLPHPGEGSRIRGRERRERAACRSFDSCPSGARRGLPAPPPRYPATGAAPAAGADAQEGSGGLGSGQDAGAGRRGDHHPSPDQDPGEAEAGAEVGVLDDDGGQFCAGPTFQGPRLHLELGGESQCAECFVNIAAR